MIERSLILVLFLMITATVLADEDKDLSSIKQQLKNTEAEKEFQKLISKYHPYGEIVFDITVYKKGKVESVFKSSGTITEREFINELINYIKALQFDIKLNKNQKIKIQYTYLFN